MCPLGKAMEAVAERTKLSSVEIEFIKFQRAYISTSHHPPKIVRMTRGKSRISIKKNREKPHICQVFLGSRKIVSNICLSKNK